MNSKNLFMKLTIPLLIGLMMSMVLSCSGESEQAQEKTSAKTDDAVPVVVEKISEKPFTKTLSFFAQMRGVKEAIEGAAIGGRIEKINATVGTRVKKDDVIVEFPEDAPASMYLQAKTAYENSKKNYERAKALLKAGETSRANYDGLETKYLVDKSNFETQYQMLYIRAPFDGVVTSVMVNEGDNVKEKAPLFAVADLSKITCKIWAAEEEIKQIKKGMTATISASDTAVTGEVKEISMTADPHRRSFYAEIEFSNPDNILKSGITESVDIDVYKNPTAIVVPRNLVRSDDDGNFVMIEKNSKSEKRYITIGNEMDINMEVMSGLNPGENLIIKGGAKLAENDKVKVIQ